MSINELPQEADFTRMFLKGALNSYERYQDVLATVKASSRADSKAQVTIMNLWWLINGVYFNPEIDIRELFWEIRIIGFELGKDHENFIDDVLKQLVNSKSLASWATPESVRDIVSKLMFSGASLKEEV